MLIKQINIREGINAFIWKITSVTQLRRAQQICFTVEGYVDDNFNSIASITEHDGNDYLKTTTTEIVFKNHDRPSLVMFTFTVDLDLDALIYSNTDVYNYLYTWLVTQNKFFENAVKL